MSDMRDAFERTVRATWSDSYIFTRDTDGHYCDEVLDGMWWAWQAASAQSGQGAEVMDWGPKPSKPGRYVVRGFDSAGTEALVCVAEDDGELVCNLHDSNSDPLESYSNLMSEISERFEWVELHIHPQPAQQGSVPEGRVAIPKDVAAAKGMYLVGYSWLKHNAPQELTTPQPEGDGWTAEAEPYWVRGFQGWKAKDFYGHEFSLQKSILATEDCIWFGLNDADPCVLHGDAKRLGIKTDFTSGWVKYPIPEEVSLQTRMHLSREQVNKLLPILQHFVRSGDLPKPPAEQEGE